MSYLICAVIKPPTKLDIVYYKLGIKFDLDSELNPTFFYISYNSNYPHSYLVNSVIKLNQAIQTLRKILNTNKQARCEIKRAIKSNIFPYHVEETTDKKIFMIIL